ncbi:hypothetical protein GCM10007164_24570 [Luteimonas padinae]|uniref:Toxin-antitoxin system HicB family antitoxin n=1 Tax=Luteimonas padinae TaxID=1714359 RepID=A0ABV6SUM0_9GAMM|nr:toxin-antitoxin system HicB family antitoxin [Luteimonas padinae]GHD74243.1 hypothetical protein GCM10007164_24570 [Luteimonas padinae]
MSTIANFPLRLPADLKEAAARQASDSGVSINQFIATALAARVGATAEAERYFAARSKRAQAGQARLVLARAGKGKPPRKGDVPAES